MWVGGLVNDIGDWLLLIALPVYVFTETRSGVIRWRAASAGSKLTFQAVVVAGTRSLRLSAPVTVQLP